MRTLLLLCAACLAAPAVLAQGRELQRDPAGDPRQNQKVERIVHEDASNRIDEVRVGGQTQSISVQPKGEAPGYEIQPTDMLRSRPGDHREGLSGATGQRVWNVLKF
jgi:hypothetical protein